MAYAVMGGLVSATVLTLVFLPTLYVAWFRIKPSDAHRMIGAASHAAPHTAGLPALA
jgi:hypothetical protein